MALKIRALRKGRNKLPYYRIVVIDEKKSRDGKYIENVGTYDPISKEDQFSYKLKKDLIVKWISRGAQLSGIVRKLLSKEGLLKELSFKKKKETPKATKVTKKSRKSRYHSLKDKIKKRQEDTRKKKEGEAKKKQVEKKKETNKGAVSENNEKSKAKKATTLEQSQKKAGTNQEIKK